MYIELITGAAMSSLILVGVFFSRYSYFGITDKRVVGYSGVGSATSIRFEDITRVHSVRGFNSLFFPRIKIEYRGKRSNLIEGKPKSFTLPYLHNHMDIIGIIFHNTPNISGENVRHSAPKVRNHHDDIL
eukprot:TRINITY_DN2818_c0_g1_i2.p1 TRINITY_DN2818_c0_g1~~TRINITY_DN2818_c0_g1_i2.p1  ORF type:complete len:130 (-),score=18.85 TRINITY_DN2818_c0_g1_i2:28-417(-)